MTTDRTTRDRVRDLLGMSQVLFARFLGVDANTVRSWEQGTRPPVRSRGGSWMRSKTIQNTGGGGSSSVQRVLRPARQDPIGEVDSATLDAS